MLQQIVPQRYPNGYFLGNGGGSHLLLRVRTTFKSISSAALFDAHLADVSGTALLRFKLSPQALGAFALQRPKDNAYIADLVARDLAAITSESVDPQGITRVTLQMRGFTQENVLEIDTWRVPLGAWSVTGGAVDSVTIDVLGSK